MDRDSIFDADVLGFLKATGLKPKRTSVQAPRQNGTAERWIGSCRREMLDHMIPLHEEHLGRLVRDYVRYHQEDRIHDSFDKDTPSWRPVEPKPAPDATAISLPRLGPTDIAAVNRNRCLRRSSAASTGWHLCAPVDDE